MSGPKAQAVQLTEDERQALVTLIRAHKTPQRVVFRARIILGLAQGTPVKVLAQALQTRRGTIQDWRTHWLSRSTLPVEQRLKDGPRSGAPATFTPEQWCQILALACEPPDLSGRPITHWTPRELAEEAIHRRIVPQISARHLARFLKRSRFEAPSKPVLAQSRARPSRAE